MLSRRKQITINLMITALLFTASAGVGYAANQGGTENTPKPGDYSGIVKTGDEDANNQEVTIDTTVLGNVYGGKAEKGNVNGNRIDISGGTIGRDVYGGYSDIGNANGNSVTISGGIIDQDVYGGNGKITANNQVIITNGTIKRDVYGGYSYDGNANGNRIDISGGTIARDIYGGYSDNDTGNAKENRVTISDGTIGRDIFGGYSRRANAEGNSVTISGGKIDGVVFGGYSYNGNANGNSATIKGGEIKEAVYGGYSRRANAEGNSVTISGGKIDGNVYGGYSYNGNAEGNSVTISGGKIDGIVYGGYGKTTANNQVIITNGTIDRAVYGGYSYNGNAEGNSATIKGGEIKEAVYGGYSRSGTAEGNSATISGGKIDGNVYGGYSYNGNAINNMVTIKGNPTFGASNILYGGYDGGTGTDVLTGNTLEVYRSTNSAGTHVVEGVENFARMNFYLGNTTKNGDVMLKVVNEVKLSKTDIGVDIAKGEKPNLLVGDKVTLLESDAKFTTTPKSQTAYAGIEKIYDLDFFKEDKAIGVTVNKAEKNSKVRSIPVAQMTGQFMLRMGGDAIADQGMTSALVATKMEQVENLNDGEGGMPSLGTEKSFLNKGAVFATIGGGTSKYKTSGTSDVNSYNIVTGMAWRINQPKNNNLLLGAFFEGGWGNYTTHNSYADGNVRGDGSSDYMGGGILGRYEFASGTYVEGSVRMGQVKNDYHSDDLRGAGDGRLGYNTSDSYTGAHLGLGYIKKINDQAELDLYGKYLYTHQGGSSVTIVGDNISFDPTNSHRLRLGARLAQKTTKDFNGYVGLAYEYEFDGKMGSSINHNPILAPSVKGSSGILELGVIFKPTKNKNLSIDLSVNGYAGKREGVSGNLQFKYLF